MKIIFQHINSLIILLIIIGLLGASCDDPFSSDDEEKGVEFNTIHGYTLSSNAPLDEGTNYYVILDQSLWEALFSPRPFPYDQSSIESIDFTNTFIVSLIKYGPETWQMAADSVTVKNGKLTYRYYATPVTENSAGNLATSLTIRLPRIRISSVQFIENDEVGYKLENISLE